MIRWHKEHGTFSLDRIMIDGFTPEELQRIESRHDKRYVLDSMNQVSPGIGDCLECGYGVYGMDVYNGTVVLTVGSSCD